MRLLLDSFWRAGFYCLTPRVIVLSLLPLGLMVLLSAALGYWFWDAAVAQVQDWLEASSLLVMVWRWFEGMGVARLKTVVAPLVVIFTATPLVVVAALMAVSLFMTPGLARYVADRRFAQMERKHGGSFWQGLGWSLLSVLLALGGMLLTLPLWLVPPLALVLPAVIWGWLTYRVMAFDVLAEFASRPEREALLARHRLSLLAIGVTTGLMGAAPSVVWASGALFAAAFVVLIPVAIWIYMLVFSFSSLWFAHFALAALAEQRERVLGEVIDVPATTEGTSPHASERLASPHEPLDDRPPHQRQP
ncbi:MAG: EI24 domain-containing protein [Limnohabitans sp.]|jgi:Etoposide-induced protein 2.4 (EI24)